MLQGDLPPNEALKALVIFEGKFSRLKEERDNVAKAKEALELAEPGTGWALLQEDNYPIFKNYEKYLVSTVKSSRYKRQGALFVGET